MSAQAAHSATSRAAAAAAAIAPLERRTPCPPDALRADADRCGESVFGAGSAFCAGAPPTVAAPGVVGVVAKPGVVAVGVAVAVGVGIGDELLPWTRAEAGMGKAGGVLA